MIAWMPDSTLGSKVRAPRRTERMTPVELARRLGISPSCLNLLEHNRRALRAELLVKLADVLPVDLKTLSAAQDSRVISDLLEAFGDPLFDETHVMAGDVRELAASYPGAARAVLHLYEAYRST